MSEQTTTATATATAGGGKVQADPYRYGWRYVRRLGPNTIELALHEGRNRQVRRMLEAVGHPVARLHRSAYAGLTLEGLEPGRWRKLEPSEVDALRAG